MKRYNNALLINCYENFGLTNFELIAKKPHPMDPIISIRNLYKSYGSKEVLRGINLDIYPRCV